MIHEFAGVRLDDQRFTLTGPTGAIHVEPQVFSLLQHLVAHRERVVPKEELLDEIWGGRFVSESALTSRIKAARRAVGDDGQAQRVIKTVHGRGYQLVAEVRELVDLRHPGADRPAGPDRTRSDVRRSLPPLRSTPIGRDHDIAGVIDRVRSAALVTVAGPGGVGKTTLALAAAHQLASELVDGAVFVDLTGVAPDADITRAVADAADVEGTAAGSLDALAEHLARRPVLLVLDNCEHVLDRCVELVDHILEVGPSARILATSREPLRVPGEHVWPLGPLGDAGPALFVERARAAEPRVTWDADDPRVVSLCRQLDNVPLALELAAGQLRRFELDELRRRFENRLTLLARGNREVSRHSTMEATIDWSYQLLDPAERSLLRNLSVFPATFDLDAVEATSPPALADDAAALFGELVDKSLVVRAPGTGRYRLLETIRTFAADRLQRAKEDEAAVERHRAHVVERVASASRLDRWLSAQLAASFREDLQNARQALHGCIDGGHVEDAVELAVGAAFLWRNAMGCAEGDAWVDELRSLPLEPGDRLWVEILRADIGQGRGDYHQMFEAATAARHLAEGSDDPAGACLAEHYGALARLTDPDHARSRLLPALELARASGDARLLTLVQAFLAVAELAADARDRARDLVEALILGASDDGYDRFITHWAGWMLAVRDRDAEEARRWMGDQQAFLDRTGIVETWLSSFSTAMSEAADGADIRELLARALALADREGYQADGDCLLALSYSEMCAGRFAAAAELLGTAIGTGINATAHYVLYRVVLDRLLTEHLDPDEIAAAMARGRGHDAAGTIAAHGISRPVAKVANANVVESG